MKWEKQIAQCIFPRLIVSRYQTDNSYKEHICRLVKLGVGGFCVFDGSTHSVKSVTDELQFLADVPLLFCADFEHGLPMRLTDGTAFPHHQALAMASQKQPQAHFTESVAAAIAREAKACGVRWNLAPVSDINSNIRNPVINVRSFGQTEALVSHNVRAYINGTHSEKVATCAKHFPGHGDTSVDSHIEFPVITQTWDSLRRRELRPFQAAMAAGVSAIMLGHLHVGQFKAGGYWEENAAELQQMQQSKKQARSKWDGLIVTDALDMQAVLHSKQIPHFYRWQYDSPELSAFMAGAHVLLMPEDPEEIIELIHNEACKSYYNIIAGLQSHIKDSQQRIHRLKQWVELIPQYSLADDRPHLFGSHLGLALRAAHAACDVKYTGRKGSHSAYFPLPPEAAYAAFAVLQQAGDIQAASRFFTMLAQAAPADCDYSYIDENITDWQLAGLADEIPDAELLVFALFYKGRGYSEQLGNAGQINYIIKTLAEGRPYVVVCFGDPYIADDIASTIKILTYSDSFASLAAAVMLLTGRELVE